MRAAAPPTARRSATPRSADDAGARPRSPALGDDLPTHAPHDERRTPLIAAADISLALARLGVAPSDTICVHSDVRSSLRVEGRSIAGKLDTVIAGLRGAVPGGTLVVPTFTYSFCDGADFDVGSSPSTVGALTERFRSLPGVRRTPEPIFSVAVDGPLAPSWERDLFAIENKECFGPRSIFAYLLERDAKLVLYGVGLQVLTFVHYVEQVLAVPYRYMKTFSGTVSDGDARRQVTARYFVRQLDQDVELHLDPLERVLLADGRARAETLPDGPRILVTDAAAVLEVVRRELASNPAFLLRRGHRDAIT